jgi:hypothetical protein
MKEVVDLRTPCAVAIEKRTEEVVDLQLPSKKEWKRGWTSLCGCAVAVEGLALLSPCVNGPAMAVVSIHI